MHATSTQFQTRRRMSVAEVLARLDHRKLLRLGVWVVFCVLLVVLT